MRYSLIVYLLAIVLGVSGLTHAMFTDEVSTIGYVVPVVKKRLYALDHGLVSSTRVPVLVIGATHSGSVVSHSLPSVTVDVRQALADQQKTMKNNINPIPMPVLKAEQTELVTAQTGIIHTGAQSDMIYLNNWQYVNVAQVRDVWLQWTNYLRTEQLGDRDLYIADGRLNATATAWSQYSANIGSISHRRKASDGYYNYNGLVQWFHDKGQELTGSPIVFRNISRATFSESIGRGTYSCREADCTDEVIEATRSTWRFFYGERAANGVHYRALTHKLFGVQGLGIAFSGKKYFLTIHYGTQILK